MKGYSMSKEIRSFKTKQNFVVYLAEHPEERFWQAIRNFSGNDFVLVAKYDNIMEGGHLWDEPIDTFHREEL